MKDGHVVIAHTLQSVDGVDATALVNDSSRRAAALANTLTKQRVDAAKDQEGTEFSKLTWVVRLADGSVLLAIDEAGGDLRKAEGALGLVAGEKGYVVSPDLLAALGENSGLSAQAGEAPTDINGAAISATAAFPHEEPEPEPEPEAQAEETYVEETYYPEETYVEETYTEPTYEEPAYTEPAYTEPVYEEPTYEAPADAGGYEEFNYQGDGEGE